jgi:hypothetical protein
MVKQQNLFILKEIVVYKTYIRWEEDSYKLVTTFLKRMSYFFISKVGKYTIGNLFR